MIKLGTDCSGIGCPEEALKRLNVEHECIFASDIDKNAKKSYEANHNVNIFYDNIYSRPFNITVDLYVAGLPCQAFSISGKRLGENDARGILFYNAYEYIKQSKPKAIIIENVKGLLSSDDGRTFDTWCSLLGKSINGQELLIKHPDNLGYDIYWKVLNSKDFGVGQNRERVFIVAVNGSYTFPSPTDSTKRIKDHLEENVDNKYYIKNGHSLYKKIQEINTSLCDINTNCKTYISAAIRGRNGNQTFETSFNDIANCITTVGKDSLICQLNPSKESGGMQPYQQNRVYDINGIVPTVQTTAPYNVIDANSVRRLTPREYFRLQGYSDEFFDNCSKVVSETSLYKQAGNSITVNVMVEIIRNLIKFKHL